MAYRLRLAPGRAYEQLTGRPWVSTAGRTRDGARLGRSGRRLPWLFLSVDFEWLKVVRGVDWAWVRTRKKPYLAKTTWLTQQIAPWAREGSGQDAPHTAWSDWWDAWGGPASELRVIFDFEPGGRDRHTIRVRGTGAQHEVKATFVFDLLSIDGSEEAIAATARRHLGDALTAIGRRLEMPAPPALPLTRRERAASTTMADSD